MATLTRRYENYLRGDSLKVVKNNRHFMSSDLIVMWLIQSILRSQQGQCELYKIPSEKS